MNNVFAKFTSPSNDPGGSKLQLIVILDAIKACTAISLNSYVRPFLIFDKFLSWYNDNLAAVLSLALPIMKSLKGGRVRFIDKISTISARFYTSRWKLVGIVGIFTKGENRKQRM